MAQQHGLAAVLLADNNRIIAPSDGSVFGTGASATGGGAGRVVLGRGVSIIGGLSYGQQGYHGSRLQDVFLVAAKLRYVHDLSPTSHLLLEAGGFWSPTGNYRFTRTYANGAGTATGQGASSGNQNYVFGRIGAVFDATAADEIGLIAEAGRQTLHTNGYVEPLTAANPFEAHVTDATDTSTVVKLRAQWSHSYSRSVDMTLWAAAADGIDYHTTLIAAVPGIGVLSPHGANQLWGEFGARFGYRLSDRFGIDLFANAVDDGYDQHTHATFGDDIKVEF